MLVSKSDDGRVLVLDDGWGASLVDGVWKFGAWFNADDLKDDFRRVTDSAEATAWLTAARSSLSDARLES